MAAAGAGRGRGGGPQLGRPHPRPPPQIFLNLSAAHYPERLGTFFIVSPPAVFNTLWRAISHFIDPVTKQKVGAGAGAGAGLRLGRGGGGGWCLQGQGSSA